MLTMHYSGIPVSRTSRGNANWLEKSGVKLQCLTEERERLLVRVIRRFEKMRVREIVIPLYFIKKRRKLFRKFIQFE